MMFPCIDGARRPNVYGLIPWPGLWGYWYLEHTSKSVLWSPWILSLCRCDKPKSTPKHRSLVHIHFISSWHTFSDLKSKRTTWNSARLYLANLSSGLAAQVVVTARPPSLSSWSSPRCEPTTRAPTRWPCASPFWWHLIHVCCLLLIGLLI